MKKFLALVSVLACALSLVACAAGDLDNTNLQTETTKNTYMVEIADNYPIENTLNNTYEAGEQVTIKLSTITELYYMVYVNGVERDFDRDTSDLAYTYYTFTMPSSDVLIEIKDVSVDIPEATQE